MRFLPTGALFCLLWVASLGNGAALFAANGTVSAQPGPGSSNAEQDEGWSFDDVKDVFEAIHFFAITIGIGVGTWWFVTRYLSSTGSLMIELDAGAHPGDTRLVQITAKVRNKGSARAPLRRCTFTIFAIEPDGLNFSANLRKGVLLREGAGLTSIMEEDFALVQTSVAPGSEVLLTAVTLLSPSLDSCLLTARLIGADERSPIVTSQVVLMGEE